MHLEFTVLFLYIEPCLLDPKAHYPYIYTQMVLKNQVRKTSTIDLLPFKLSATTTIVRMIAIQVITKMVTITPFLSSFLFMSLVVSKIRSLFMSAEWGGVSGNARLGPGKSKIFMNIWLQSFFLSVDSVLEGIEY